MPKGAFDCQPPRSKPSGESLRTLSVFKRCSRVPRVQSSAPHAPRTRGWRSSHPGAASESSPALDGPSVVLPESPLRPSCLLACAPPPSAALGSRASPPLPLAQAVCACTARLFFPSSAAATPTPGMRAASVCAPCGCAPGSPSVCARGSADMCV